MNLIVFDLEWNQCPAGKEHEVTELPFEIIEIGAVKLNENREIVDTFHVMVKPVLYRRMHPAIHKVVGLSMKEVIREGIPFREAASSFLLWCGEEYRLCTWGTLDLVELQRNLKYHHCSELLPGPILYEDVQKLFALTYETRKERRALNWAVRYLQIPEDRKYHLALDDAWYTALVLQHIPEGVIQSQYSIDTYCNPKTREEEIRLRYPDYEKFISMEFGTKEEVMADSLVTEVRCFCCNRRLRKVVRWFSGGNKHFLAVGRCGEHGFMKCKVRIRKTDQHRYYAVKTTKPIYAEDAEKVRQKRLNLKVKRQLKRQTS